VAFFDKICYQLLHHDIFQILIELTFSGTEYLCFFQTDKLTGKLEYYCGGSVISKRYKVHATNSYRLPFETCILLSIFSGTF